MTKKKYRRYSPEFKRHALRRASEDGVTDREVCKDLGVSERQLRRWRDQFRLLGEEAFPGLNISRDEELNDLRKRLAKAEQERDLFKRCGGFQGVLLHHSDRGAQYTSDDFRDELAKHGIECSMSARGNCYDNAVVESFFGLLKREHVNRTRYLTRKQAEADIFDYIERFYNRKRRHGILVI
jgi:transposase InsO family protein